jgi:glycine cleavage system H protein
MSDIKYLETHEWYLINEEVITVGISDFAQNELGDIVYVTLPEVGQTFEKGAPVVEVEATKTVAEAYAPMDCTITEVNSQLETEPETINNYHCGDGWMFKSKVNAVVDSGMSYKEYETFVS